MLSLSLWLPSLLLKGLVRNWGIGLIGKILVHNNAGNPEQQAEDKDYCGGIVQPLELEPAFRFLVAGGITSINSKEVPERIRGSMGFIP